MNRYFVTYLLTYLITCVVKAAWMWRAVAMLRCRERHQWLRRQFRSYVASWRLSARTLRHGQPSATLALAVYVCLSVCLSDGLLWKNIAVDCNFVIFQLRFLVLFFSRPRSEGWPHHGRTFSIYLCPLSFWLTLPRGSPVHVLMFSIQAVRGLPRLRAPGIVPCNACINSSSRLLPCFLMVWP